MLLRALALSLLLTSAAGIFGLHERAQAEEPSAAKEVDQVDGDTDDIIFGDVFELPKGEEIPEAAEEPITKVVTVHCGKAPPPGTIRGVVIPIPPGAKLLGYRTWMANSPWAPNRKCRSEYKPLGWQLCPATRRECSIGWSRVRLFRATDREVRVRFENWKHDNHRGGALRVWYRY